MFGHDDKKDQKEDNQEPMAEHQENVVQPISKTPPNEGLVGVSGSTPPSSASTVASSDDDIDKIVNELNGDEDSQNTSTAPLPDDDDSADNDEEPQTPSELLNIKKSALQELSPLLDELDQSPEEKLNILMMTIQASDDQSLIPNAFAAAKKIDDRKQRAQAMLDIINEINYFTKKQ